MGQVRLTAVFSVGQDRFTVVFTLGFLRRANVSVYFSMGLLMLDAHVESDGPKAIAFLYMLMQN